MRRIWSASSHGAHTRPKVTRMARMTPVEATAVNILFAYLAGKEDQPPRVVVLALETLASRAYNRLQAGVSEKSVRRQWPAAYDQS